MENAVAIGVVLVVEMYLRRRGVHWLTVAVCSPHIPRSLFPPVTMQTRDCLGRTVALLGALMMAGSPSLHAQTTTQRSAARMDDAPPKAVAVQAVSLLGDTLRTLPLAPPVRARYERQLAEARAAFQRAPNNVDSLIWYGRRLGYLGYLRESIEIYSRGIARDSLNPWLYRHRGHRYISVRDFPRAIRDFERATALVQGKPDVVEEDGQPNAKNTPIGTLQSNIGYHLALAQYLQGNYAEAARVARVEYEAATNDDRRVSMAHWLYLSLRHAGRADEAKQLVAPMGGTMNIIENEAYHRLMLLYRGDATAEATLALGADGQFSVTDASAAYGVANWYLFNGRPRDAEALLRRIVQAGQWGAFGTIAAEAQLARMR